MISCVEEERGVILWTEFHRRGAIPWRVGSDPAKNPIDRLLAAADDVVDALGFKTRPREQRAQRDRALSLRAQRLE